MVDKLRLGLPAQEGQTQSGSQNFAFNVSGNSTGIPRVGTVTFTSAADGLTATITVTQFSSLDDDRDGLSNEEETKPFFIIEGDFTWEQARLDAIRRGGTLAVITTQDKADDLADVVTPTTNLWIGASDEAGLGNFAWVTDPPTPIDVIFADTKWASLPTQQPDSVFGVSGIALQPDFTWNDLNKFTVLSGYVLELPATESAESIFTGRHPCTGTVNCGSIVMVMAFWAILRLSSELIQELLTLTGMVSVMARNSIHLTW